MTRLEVPDLAEPRPVPPTEHAERTLPGGLRVLAVKRASIPLVEVRLRVPFGSEGGAQAAAHRARAGLLSQTLLSGTETMSTTELAAELQAVGGGLSASADADRLLIAGNALAPGLPRLLELLAEVLTGATYPEREVVTERERMADRLELAASQPSHIARKALVGRLHGTHPYGVYSAEPETVRGLEAPVLRSMHAERLAPAGSVLVVVGDIDPDGVLDTVAEALAGWKTEAEPFEVPPMPGIVSGPTVLVDRPGAVQSSLRLGAPAVGRGHAEYPALQIANLIFGGYFSSRLTENIREDKGYTYSPHSLVEHMRAGSQVVVDADVATEVTGPALVEIAYEMGRIASVPVRADELEQARQYAIGTLALSVASQGGLASMVMALTTAGLGIEWLAEHPRNLAGVTLEQVHEAAARYLAPARAVTIVVGDLASMRAQVEALGPVVAA